MISEPEFLIIGMERSGTHWVSALLHHHPDIACFPSLPFSTEPGKNKIGEVHLFNTLASLEPDADKKLFTRPFEDFLTKYNKVFADLVPLKDKIPKSELYEKFKQRYNKYCNEQKGNKKIVGESTPAYVFHLDFIDTIYPDIKKICIIRDPKDKIVSWHFNLIRKDRIPADTQITEEFALGYLNERIIPEYQALLDYQGDVHCLSYERLHTEGPQLVKDMLNYLDMAIDPDTISHMIEEASFKKQTAREDGDSGRQPGEAKVKSGLRKGIAGDWNNHMDQKLGEKIDNLVEKVRNQVIKKYNINI